MMCVRQPRATTLKLFARSDVAYLLGAPRLLRARERVFSRRSTTRAADNLGGGERG